jgi:hypothetical protein
MSVSKWFDKEAAMKTGFYGFLLVVICLFLLPSLAIAQDTTVPDLTGLSVPASAAALNRNGLALGSQQGEPWTEESGQAANTISAQSVPPGEVVVLGSAIDVTVLRSPNVLLVYDTEMFTLINQTGEPLPLGGLTFNAVEGDRQASFDATRWAGSLDPGDRCMQLWAVGRTSPDRPGACTGVQRWLSTNNPAAHFWTNGITRFNVVLDGIERAVCDGAAPDGTRTRCAFYLPVGGSAGDVTPYIYLAYTTDRLIVRNQSADQWMPLGQTQIANYNPQLPQPGLTLTVGDPELFGNPETVANIRRLAPGQCLLFTNSSPDATTPPEDCDVIARLDIDPRLIFWAADFEIVSATDGRRHMCLAATEGTLTICVMPR